MGNSRTRTGALLAYSNSSGSGCRVYGYHAVNFIIHQTLPARLQGVR